MSRKLKTFVTSLGFFDRAIAAPSMKAALEAWGADSNLFHQGAAEETDDPDIVAATMAAPGVVLKRPVGSRGAFRERADLPTDVELEDASTKAAKAKAGKRPKTTQPKRQSDPAAERKAAAAYEREERHRSRQRAKEQAVRDRLRKRRQAAMEKAQRTLDVARERHEERVAQIRAQIEVLENKLRTDDERWKKESSRLEDALKRARS
ncbi:cell envelope biogenesis protein TolA [Bradyrhizobium elkanii]|uniref:Cell envelope biogenesis protein TolA n=1 Tax=Bradyrhizobium elkanii TaxID=29448 RepID=A0A4U6RJC0_BRAEL|nr:cell envelope biogenesis protein TolA [Bradyrhizobium elkanii]TKV74153.1 cell envelope biogenesis protein TolA [Bradyrhizobium elkanii]